MVDNAAIQKLLIDCAEAEIMPYYQKLAAHEIQTKDNDSIVTVVDHNVEQYLAEKLHEILPGSLMVGEEDFENDPTVLQKAIHADHVWIIDPVDGTGNFSKGLPDFAMMLTLVSHGEYAGAWIYAPVSKTMASWVQGEDVCVNNVPCIFDTKAKELNTMVGGEHISHFWVNDKATIHANRKKYFAECISRGCVGIQWITMVQGKLDFVSFGMGNPWDISAGAAMVQAMGGTALDLQGRKLAGEHLYTIQSAMLATKSADNWRDVREHMLRDVNWENYCA